MKKNIFSELINTNSLERMAQNLYGAAGIPVGILGVDGTIYIKAGWQDICTKFHRIHTDSCNRCLISDTYINEHLKDGNPVAYKCLNNLQEIGVPIIIANQHIATLYLGQFFYEDEVIDVEIFRAQALQFGFDEKEYLNALKNVPIFSRKKVEHIMEYYLGLVNTLAESGLRQLEYKNSQQQLNDSQKYLDKIVNSVNDAIFIGDFAGNIIDVNKSAEQMFGYTRDELINMNIKKLISQTSSSTTFKILESLNRARNENSFIIECICKTKSNTDFWVEFNVSKIMLDNNEKILATVRDITARKQEELALQKEALEMETLRTEFFANISHELKTPLNIILGAVQIIGMLIQNEDKPIDKQRIKNNLNVEKQNCFRLLRLINNLIDSTKLDSGFFELNMVNCNIISLIEEITMSVADYTNNNKITLTFDTEVEEKIVACDLDKIERIMLNILSNAVKFTSCGGDIFVNIYDGEEYITITIEDTGIGIPSEKLNIIFDRFRQVDKSFTRNHEGSGIGLSIVKSLIEIQGGTISVESKYGCGTKFLITFPTRVLDCDNGDENTKTVTNIINDCVERIKVEFSDIYK